KGSSRKRQAGGQCRTRYLEHEILRIFFIWRPFYRAGLERHKRSRLIHCARGGIRGMRAQGWTVDAGPSNVASRLEVIFGGNNRHGRACPRATETDARNPA